MAYYYNTLGADPEAAETAKDGTAWIRWGKDVYTVGMDVVKEFIKQKYGSNTAQQVVQNPNSDSSQSLMREFLQYQMMLNNNQQQLPQQQEKDNTMLYVALGIGALALIMMMNNNDSRRR